MQEWIFLESAHLQHRKKNHSKILSCNKKYVNAERSSNRDFSRDHNFEFCKMTTTVKMAPAQTACSVWSPQAKKNYSCILKLKLPQKQNTQIVHVQEYKHPQRVKWHQCRQPCGLSQSLWSPKAQENFFIYTKQGWGQIL